MVDANEYQRQAARTLIEDADAPVLRARTTRILWNTLGLAGEAGEVADTIKKQVLHGHGLDTARVAEELGDLMWYVAALCSCLDLNLSDVLLGNIHKLQARYPEGWDANRSRH